MKFTIDFEELIKLKNNYIVITNFRISVIFLAMDKRTILMLFIAVTTAFATRSFAQSDESYIHIRENDLMTDNWKVIWYDDFDGSALDTTKWTKIPPNNADWGNYMTSDPACFDLERGKLYLKGIVNPDTSKDPRPYLTFRFIE